MNDKLESGMIETCLALLKQHAKVCVLSLLMTFLGGATVVQMSVMQTAAYGWILLLWLVVVLGLCQAYLAVRVGVDCHLLESVVDKQTNSTEMFSILDLSLVKLGLLKAPQRGRELNERLTACIHLFKLQAGVCSLQFLALTIFVMMAGIF